MNHLNLKVCFVLLSLTVILGCGSKDDRRTPPHSFSVFYTCDTRGHIEPCGCSSGMAGGLSRRQTHLIEDLPRDYLLVDAGDVTAGARDWELLEFKYILKGYQLMGYHAVNLGVREISLGAENLKTMQTYFNPIVSANVVGDDRQPICHPYIVKELSNGYRCGITGVVDDRIADEALGPGLSVVAPAEALSTLLPEMQTMVDYIVLLAFMDEVAMKDLANQFFELDLIVGGQVQKASNDAIIENRSAIVFNTDKGKAVGRLDLTRGPEMTWNYDNNFKTLEESMTQAPDFVALVEAFKGELKVQDFRPVKDDEDGLSSIAAKQNKVANKYIGSKSCQECHEKSYAAWYKSKHSHAFATLEAKGHQYNPRCLRCHTVGYMETDGYINQRLTPKLIDVGCECCHGPRDLHARKQNGESIPDEDLEVKTTACQQCHDEENSPNFDEIKYWQEIIHGKE